MRTPDELIDALVEKYAGPTPFLRKLVKEALTELVSALAAPSQTPQVSASLEVLRGMAKDAIQRELPEDEPDTIPDWCYNTILQTALMGVATPDPQTAHEEPITIRGTTWPSFDAYVTDLIAYVEAGPAGEMWTDVVYVMTRQRDALRQRAVPQTAIREQVMALKSSRPFDPTTSSYAQGYEDAKADVLQALCAETPQEKETA